MLLLKDTSRIEVLADGEISVVEVDFELYATGVKNLIDNALKYSSDKVVVTIDKGALCISSVGDELELERLEFDRAFNRRVVWTLTWTLYSKSNFQKAWPCPKIQTRRWQKYFYDMFWGVI